MSLNIEQIKSKNQNQKLNKRKLTITIVNQELQTLIQLKVSCSKSIQQIKCLILENKYFDLNKKLNLIGFSTANDDPLLNYRLSQGIGFFNHNIVIKPIYKNQSLTGLNKYKLQKCLATGGFSKVYLARSLLTGQFVAAKFVDKTKVSSEDKKILIMNQKTVNQVSEYPFLVKMHQFIQTEHFYVFIMDYCPGGQLFYLLRFVKRMSQQEAKIYFIEILLGIQYLHKKGIMYRDLKPQNVMIDQSGHVKIADFGLAKFYRQKSYSFCGSIQYMSPQIVTNVGHSFEVDYYCIGALLFELLIGCPPFYNPDQSQYQTKKDIAYKQVQFPEDIQLSYEVKDLIGKLLNKNPNQRLGHFGGSKQIMLHPWIGKINRKQIEARHCEVPFPPNLEKFNFDPDQIGLSEQRFTTKIRDQYRQLRCKKPIRNKERKSVQKIQKTSPYMRKLSHNQKSFQKSKNTISFASLLKGSKQNPYSTVLKEVSNKNYKINFYKDRFKSKINQFQSNIEKKSSLKKLRKKIYFPIKIYMRTQSNEIQKINSVSSYSCLNDKKIYTQSNEIVKMSMNKTFKSGSKNSKLLNQQQKQSKHEDSHLNKQNTQKQYNFLKKSCNFKLKKCFKQNRQQKFNNNHKFV